MPDRRRALLTLWPNLLGIGSRLTAIPEYCMFTEYLYMIAMHIDRHLEASIA